MISEKQKGKERKGKEEKEDKSEIGEAREEKRMIEKGAR